MAPEMKMKTSTIPRSSAEDNHRIWTVHSPNVDFEFAGAPRDRTLANEFLFLSHAMVSPSNPGG